jgi:arylformamidase
MRSDGEMSRFAAVVILVGILAACTSDPASTSATTVPDGASDASCALTAEQQDISYVEEGSPLQRLDLYRPPATGCDPLPLVVWVHGGGWTIGDKANSMDDKVRLWNEAGWAVASVNYRLTDPDVPERERVVAPSHNEDVAAALAWLVGHANEIGVDSDHLALLGHSAGAGIVASLATDPAYLRAVGMEPSDVSCVAPLDTEAFSIETAVSTGRVLSNVYTNAFGTDPSRWADLSPLTHVGDAPLPDLFLVTRGSAARRDLVDRFAAAAKDARANVTMVDLPSFSHEDVNRQIGDRDDKDLTPALQDFLTACLGS